MWSANENSLFMLVIFVKSFVWSCMCTWELAIFDYCKYVLCSELQHRDCALPLCLSQSKAMIHPCAKGFLKGKTVAYSVTNL